MTEHRLGEIFYDIDLLFAEGHYLRPDLRAGFAEPTEHTETQACQPDPAAPSLQLEVAPLFA